MHLRTPAAQRGDAGDLDPEAIVQMSSWCGGERSKWNDFGAAAVNLYRAAAGNPFSSPLSDPRYLIWLLLYHFENETSRGN